MHHNDISQHDDWAAQQNWLDGTNTHHITHSWTDLRVGSGIWIGLDMFYFYLVLWFCLGTAPVLPLLSTRMYYVLLIWLCCFAAMLVTVTFCAQDKSFSWKNRLEEFRLSCKTRFCASVSVCTEFTQVRLFEHAYLQPCIFVSPPRSVHALQVGHSGQCCWCKAGQLCCAACTSGMHLEFLCRAGSWLSPLPFVGHTCQQNRLAAEGIKAARKVMLCEVMIISVCLFVTWILISWAALPENSFSSYWCFATYFFFLKKWRAQCDGGQNVSRFLFCQLLLPLFCIFLSKHKKTTRFILGDGLIRLSWWCFYTLIGPPNKIIWSDGTKEEVDHPWSEVCWWRCVPAGTGRLVRVEGKLNGAKYENSQQHNVQCVSRQI